MILRPDAVRERLRKLREVLRHLGELRGLSREEFVSSHRHHWLAERGLQLAAEALFDTGNHVLSGHFGVSAESYEDVTARLAERRVISGILRERLRGLGGFRNILVHGYLELDQDRVFDFLQSELETLGAFADEVEAFLERVGA